MSKKFVRCGIREEWLSERDNLSDVKKAVTRIEAMIRNDVGLEPLDQFEVAINVLIRFVNQCEFEGEEGLGTIEKVVRLFTQIETKRHS